MKTINLNKILIWWWWSNQVCYLRQLCNTQDTDYQIHVNQLWQYAWWMLGCSSEPQSEGTGQKINMSIIRVLNSCESKHVLYLPKFPRDWDNYSYYNIWLVNQATINLIGFDKPIKITFIFIKVICMSIAFLATPSNQARHMLAPAGVFISEYKNVLSPIDNW